MPGRPRNRVNVGHGIFVGLWALQKLPGRVWVGFGGYVAENACRTVAKINSRQSHPSLER